MYMRLVKKTIVNDYCFAIRDMCVQAQQTETDSTNLKFKFSNDYTIHFYPIKI